MGRVEHVFETVFDILGREFLAVLEVDVVAQLESVGQLVGRDCGQRFGELRLQDAVDVELDQILPDRLADDLGIMAAHVDRIAGDRVGRQGDRERAAAALGTCLS